MSSRRPVVIACRSEPEANHLRVLLNQIKNHEAVLDTVEPYQNTLATNMVRVWIKYVGGEKDEIDKRKSQA